MVVLRGGAFVYERGTHNPQPPHPNTGEASGLDRVESAGETFAPRLRVFRVRRGSWGMRMESLIGETECLVGETECINVQLPRKPPCINVQLPRKPPHTPTQVRPAGWIGWTACDELNNSGACILAIRTLDYEL